MTMMSEAEIIRHAGRLRAEYLRDLLARRRWWLISRGKRGRDVRKEPAFDSKLGDATT